MGTQAGSSGGGHSLWEARRWDRPHCGDRSPEEAQAASMGLVSHAEGFVFCSNDRGSHLEAHSLTYVIQRSLGPQSG